MRRASPCEAASTWKLQMRRIVSSASFASKRRDARERLVREDSERPHVRAMIGRLGHRLLGAHVGGAAEDQALHGQARRRLVLPSFGFTMRRAICAMPKSRTFATRSPSSLFVRKTFAGFKSRCVTPSACATVKPFAICETTLLTSSGCSRLSHRRCARRGLRLRGAPSRGRPCRRRCRNR